MARVERVILDEAEKAVINAGTQATRAQYSDRRNFLMMLFLNSHKEWRLWEERRVRYREASERGERVELLPYPQKLIDVVMQQTISQLKLEFPHHPHHPYTA